MAWFRRRPHARNPNLNPPLVPDLEPDRLVTTGDLGQETAWRRLRPATPEELADTARLEDETMNIDPDRDDPPGTTYGIDEQTLADGTVRVVPPDAADHRPIPPDESSSRIMFELPDTAPAVSRRRCRHCRGTGEELTVNDLLRESIALLEGNEDEVIRRFYDHLLRAAPHLAELFPADLIDPASPGPVRAPGQRTGRAQRDKLVGALASAAQLYDPTDLEAMGRLDAALKQMGERHAAFDRSDGTDDGARPEEYDAVGAILMATLRDAAGERWLPEYDSAWAACYHHLKIRMLNAQIDYRLQFPDPFARRPRL